MLRLQSVCERAAQVLWLLRPNPLESSSLFLLYLIYQQLLPALSSDFVQPLNAAHHPVSSTLEPAAVICPWLRATISSTLIPAPVAALLQPGFNARAKTVLRNILSLLSSRSRMILRLSKKLKSLPRTDNIPSLAVSLSSHCPPVTLFAPQPWPELPVSRLWVKSLFRLLPLPAEPGWVDWDGNIQSWSLASKKIQKSRLEKAWELLEDLVMNWSLGMQRG